MMNKRTILKAIFILSILVALFSLINGLKLVYEFKSNIVELTIPSELEVEPESYDLFVLSSKSVKKENVDYLISEEGVNPIVIKIQEDSANFNGRLKMSISYTLFDDVYKKIGSFESDKKQIVRIESNAQNIQSEKLAYAKEGSFVRLIDIMKYSLLFLLSVGASLISGISLLVLKRNKNKVRVG